jgi:hypothetical protein
MTLESTIVAALSGLAGGRIYPDFDDSGSGLRPYIVYQQTGGTPVNFLTGETPSKSNARVQVSVWSETRAEASAIGQQAEDALRAVAGLQTFVLGGRVATYDEETTLRGTWQEFSFWI